MSDKSIDLLCNEIKQDAGKQIQGILDEAKKRQDAKLEIARRAAGKIREELLAKAKAKAEAVKERMLSAVNLETRRIKSLAREEIINEVLQEIKLKQDSFRTKKEYVIWLENLIIEGALSLRKKELVAAVNKRDFSLLDGAFVSRVEKKLSEHHLKDIRIDLAPDDNLQDTGAVIKSRDGRVIFDNTFSARLQRMRTDLRVIIFKEIFEEYA